MEYRTSRRHVSTSDLRACANERFSRARSTSSPETPLTSECESTTLPHVTGTKRGLICRELYIMVIERGLWVQNPHSSASSTARRNAPLANATGAKDPGAPIRGHSTLGSAHPRARAERACWAFGAWGRRGGSAWPSTSSRLRRSCRLETPAIAGRCLHCAKGQPRRQGSPRRSPCRSERSQWAALVSLVPSAYPPYELVELVP